VIYTKYFSGILNSNGPFQINARQWKRVMNIVYLEGSIHSLKAIKDPKMPFKYEMVIFRYQKQLADLTGNQEPGELIREMYLLSSSS
jgi:hypothetical protein